MGKKIIQLFLLLIIGCALHLPFESFANDRPSIVRKSRPITSMGYGIARYRNQGIVVIKPKSRTQIFMHSGSTSSGVFREFTGALAVINGAYFGRIGTGSFHPAGVRTTGQRAIDPRICQDINLCSVYNMNTLSISTFPVEGRFSGSYRSSGPILVQQGIVNPNIRTNRSHRQRKTQRTIMIPQGPYFIITTTGYTLPEMADYIVKNFGLVDAINLDGGSSTTLFSRNLRFNSRARLPEFIILW